LATKNSETDAMKKPDINYNITKLSKTIVKQQ